ncbi:MAG: hypothetical protein L0J54_05085 [Halomonas sp.]|nr:hypothetical protein [Halomonas sp.]MDN6297388.1 hypothetical protein [Halomonas sp.]MDN6314083.1 hypothetical protein [Halomonas sp.]MDN6335373.1 hypothetical protein [Halomonas sp.]
MEGESTQKLTEIHVQEARRYALRLFAYVSTVFPSEWSQAWNEIITPDLLEFAFHARKVNEFCKLREETFEPINTLIVKISDNDPGNWEANYHYALNAFVHVNSFILGHSHVDHRRIFEKSEANLQATYVKITTDKFAEKTISISGLVFCFLNNVIPLIRNRYPELKF